MVVALLVLVATACAGLYGPPGAPASGEPQEVEVCLEHEECGEDRYCAKPAGDCDGEGECQDRPEVCTQLYDPVCGCDGRTYSNGCHAAAAGVNVKFEGECEEEQPESR